MSISLQSVLNQDGIQRFKDTMVHVIHQGKKSLMFCDQVGDSGAAFYDANCERQVFHVKDNVEIEVVMPHAEWKQYGRNTVLIQRQPARQWKRSLSRTTHVIIPDWQVAKLDKNDATAAQDVRFPEVRPKSVGDVFQMLSNKSVSFEEGLKCLDKCATVALAGNFMLSKAGGLYLGTTAIAQFHFAQKSYSVVALFQEELRDLTRGLSFKEVVKDALN